MAPGRMGVRLCASILLASCTVLSGLPSALASPSGGAGRGAPSDISDRSPQPTVVDPDIGPDGGWFDIHPASRAAASVTADRRSLSSGIHTVPARRSASAAASPLRTATAVETENVDLFDGEIKVFGQVDVTRVAVGNGRVIRAEVLDSAELMVIAESPGSTSLHLWHRDGSQSDFNIRVSEKDPQTRFHVDRSVRMQVRMVEFRRSALQQLGIDWSDSIAGPDLATAGDLVSNNLYRPAQEAIANHLPNAVQPFASYVGLASRLTSRINLLASRGEASTLAEPVLHCANGESASFLAGGEVPYPTSTENGQTIVQFKEYGIRLTISPRIDADGNVQTQIDTEISQLDPAVSVQGTPGLLTRRVQTAVQVRSGQTIVISGLLSSENSRDTDYLPGLGKLPVIGTFFRTRNTRRHVRELVVFVTPEILEPGGRVSSDADPEILSWIHREQRSADAWPAPWQ